MIFSQNGLLVRRLFCLLSTFCASDLAYPVSITATPTGDLLSMFLAPIPISRAMAAVTMEVPRPTLSAVVLDSKRRGRLNPKSVPSSSTHLEPLARAL